PGRRVGCGAAAKEGPGRCRVGWGMAERESGCGCDPQVSRAGGGVRPVGAGHVAAVAPPREPGRGRVAAA
ncbi:hypothetical protein P7K49_011456, partial [Saguinus oedipus]